MTSLTLPEMTRDEEIREMMKDYPGAYRITFALILVGVGILIGAALFRGDEGYTVNLYTEVLSIAVTVFILDYLNRRRDERNAERALKEQLVREAGSTSNEVAKNAIHQLRKRGWLVGKSGILAGDNVYLSFTNLHEATIYGANLTGTTLMGADLRNANLTGIEAEGANLKSASAQGANLSGANLRKADLSFANLQGAQLVNAQMQHALLCAANLKGANLSSANLEGAFIDDEVWGAAEFDETTTLPDGTNWTPGRDMREFTHPDEWAREHGAPE